METDPMHVIDRFHHLPSEKIRVIAAKHSFGDVMARTRTGQNDVVPVEASPAAFCQWQTFERTLKRCAEHIQSWGTMQAQPLILGAVRASSPSSLLREVYYRHAE
ncbi:hypothetical protein LshimejAT787_0203520 [Lyophyllum shimeji]|uniref:Uncharacterized protein n=1 Tax=Lyophyllum shimeji TaxID=47721 RepID=A0A9P3PG57_LYOSH|nr:hypothetical protein LshimejAT787_0203520 [Lyophyllum shimeji]